MSKEKSRGYTLNIPENKEFYITILDSINTGVWAVDKNENVIFFNSAMERISGLKKSQAIGSNLMTDIPGHTINVEAQFRNLYLNVKKLLETTSYGPIPIIAPKGDLSYQSGVLIPQFDENGQYDGMICTVVDTTKRKQVEKALHGSELRLIRAQKIAHMGDWEYDIEADRYVGSDEVYRIFDIDPATELSYKLLREMIHSDDRDNADRHTKSLIESGMGEPFEHRIVRSDGSIRHIYSQGEVAFDSTGKVVKLFGIMLDITERKRVEDELLKKNRNLSILYSTASITTEYNNIDDILSYALTDLLDYQGSKAGGIYLIDKESDEIVLHAHKGIPDEILEKVRRVPLTEPNVVAAMTSKDVFIKEPGRSEEIINLEKKYGIEKVITIKLQARDKVIGFVNVTLSAEYEMLEEDALVLESVGKQVGIVIENLRLFNETEKSYEELKSLDKMKDEFLSNVSHELKTPLVSIGGYSEVLNAGALGALNEGQKKAADAIVRNANRLERLINSILYLSIEESGKMIYTLKPLQIADVIEHSVLDMLPQIKKNNLTIKKQVSDNLSLIKGDEKKLMQVISNLIDNAIKFAPSGDMIISAHEDDDKLHIAVSDTGIGIPQEETNNLFKRFYQADASATRKYGGTGLGLYISKLIVDAHNGEIWAESEKGVGTTIHMTLPK